MPNQNVVVIGGAVVDFVFRTPELPEWKEAIQSKEFTKVPGGKGYNQAVTAGNLGANVSLISAVGDDEFGDQIFGKLEDRSIAHDYVKRVDNEQTAVTNVFVNSENGEAAFLGFKSVTASEHVVDSVRQAEETIKNADALLMTLEVPLEAIEKALDFVEEEDSPTISILNPAPPLGAPEFEPPLLERIELLVPNRWEAKKLLAANDASVAELAEQLQKAGVPIACVTDEERGCVVASQEWDDIKEFEAFKPLQVDTTGASDAFCGSLGVSMAKGERLEVAFTKANAAAYCVIPRKGPAPSMPTRDEVRTTLERHMDELEERGVAAHIEELDI